MPHKSYIRALFNTSKVPKGVWLQRPSQLCFLGHSVLDFVDFACNFFTDNSFTCLSLFDASHTSVGLLLAVADNSPVFGPPCRPTNTIDFFHFLSIHDPSRWKCSHIGSVGRPPFLDVDNETLPAKNQ